MFSFKDFIDLALTVRSLIPLELIFIYGVRQGMNTILFDVSMHLLLKRLISVFHCLGILVKTLTDHKSEGSFLESQVYSIDLYASDIFKIISIPANI